MKSSNPAEAVKVLKAANDLIAAFGNHRRDEYFSCFAPESTFIFYSSDRTFYSRDAYEKEWRTWEDSGLRFVSCDSTDQRVTELGPGVFLFTHRVRTTLRQGGSSQQLEERESIVFRLDPNGGYLAVHEHLSPYPS